MKDDVEIQEILVKGSGYTCTTDLSDISKPLVVRGVIKKDYIYECRSTNRDFYYIDTGYFGNFPSNVNKSGKKVWHRIVKNDVQHCETKYKNTERWEKLLRDDNRLSWKGWRDYDKKILLVLPNPKACKYYGIDYDSWITSTKDEIRKYSSLPVEERIKGTRSYRNHEYSIYDAFDSGVYATVTFNSIAAIESILYGIPAFVSVPCAASPLASTDLSKLSDPFKPSEDDIYKHACTLADGQFTLEEIANGTAWKLLQE
jgi:hypothetical protein